MTVRLNDGMSKHTHLLAAAIAAAVAAPVLAACGSDDGGGAAAEAPDFEAALKGAPPKLAEIHAQENELLPGGPEAYDARLRELRGFPIVVNKWASWCGPCRAEFPYFQSEAAKNGDEVAFLGINSNDGEDSAGEFLNEFPVPYPSYLDPDLKIADQLKGALAFPATAFYDRRGELTYVRNGPYDSADALAADIDRYAR
jgi:cytochrome c biogenesis protein CcmG, thiol:disulfide interchange protein DsbE